MLLMLLILLALFILILIPSILCNSAPIALPQDYYNQRLIPHKSLELM